MDVHFKWQWLDDEDRYVWRSDRSDDDYQILYKEEFHEFCKWAERFGFEVVEVD